MKTLLMASIATAACLVLSSAGVAGQPGTSNGVNCGMIGPTGGITPGNSGSSTNPGSPFAGGMSGSVYANAFNGSGSQQAPLTNLHPTSQYDIACKNVTTNKPPLKQMP
jgi:hypothetical protein